MARFVLTFGGWEEVWRWEDAMQGNVENGTFTTPRSFWLEEGIGEREVQVTSNGTSARPLAFEVDRFEADQASHEFNIEDIAYDSKDTVRTFPISTPKPRSKRTPQTTSFKPFTARPLPSKTTTTITTTSNPLHPPKMPSSTSNTTANAPANAVRLATSTAGNTVAGLTNTVSGVVGAGGRGLAETIEGVGGEAGRAVGKPVATLANGIDDGGHRIAAAVKKAGEGR